MALPAAARSIRAHGRVATPAFMPVGTQATVKGLAPEAVRASGADIVLANTYHLMLRPGAERIAMLGGLHKFMNWPHAILTDSGGFQVMSLCNLRKVEAAGVTFRSHLDGATVELSPERAVEIQNLLGSDIVLQLDECLKLPAPRREVERAMRLSLDWAERSKRAFEGVSPERALFAIVQGGDDAGLRRESARALVDMGFAGYAIGGLAVGEPQEVMLAVIEEVAPLLPADQPRYLMGVGTPADLVEAVARGIDLFDCVLPTRNGRHGLAFTRFGPVNLKNARHADDPRPLDAQSACCRARLFPGISASSSQGQRDAGRHPAHHRQSRLLSGRDGGHAHGNRGQAVRCFSAERQGRLGARRHPAGVTSDPIPKLVSSRHVQILC